MTPKKKPPAPPDDEPDDDVPYNPIYAGFGAWPGEIDDDEWIELAGRAVKRVGARAYFSRLLTELRLAHLDDGAEAMSDEEMLELVEGHILKQRVAHYQVLSTRSAVYALIFDDGHALPLLPASEHANTPEKLEEAVGKFLADVSVLVEPDGESLLTLAFHDNPEAAEPAAAEPDYETALALREAFERDAATVVLVTTWEAGLYIFCPSQESVLNLAAMDRDAYDEDEAIDNVEAHLTGQRVADRLRLPEGGPAALVFDDGHILPAELAAGGSARDLDAVIGKFLIMVDVRYPPPMNGDGEPAHLALTFHDDPGLVDDLNATLDEDLFGQKLEALAQDPTAVTLTLTVACGLDIFCPQEH